MKEDATIFDVNIFVFREESEWTALALEMDVRGYGTTSRSAIEDVIEMLTAQVSYAVQMGHPESVWHPAEEMYWRRWEEARRKKFMAKASGSEAPTDQIAELVPLELLASKQQDEWITESA